VIWLRAGITNRRPEVVGEYFLTAAEVEGGKYYFQINSITINPF